MDDLISRSALIEALNQSDRDARTDADIQGYCDGWNDVVEIINEQPIAYNPEKVVEEIKEYSIRTFGEIRTENIIEIVRKGGVE